MIIGNYFHGDDNEALKNVQYDVYGIAIRNLFNMAADRYKNDIRYTWVSPDFVPLIRDIRSFDHRVLQMAHDLIAAYFRYIFCPHDQNIDLPEGFDEKVYYLEAWTAYYRQEMSLLAQIDEIADAILTAVAFKNSERGYEAEDKLMEKLLERYRAMKYVR